MSKLSVLVAAAALFLGGCAGEVEGPEEFELRTDWSGVYLRSLPAADKINAEDPTVLVTVELLSPGSDEDKIRNLAAWEGGGAELEPHAVRIDATPKTHILVVGSEATAEEIEAGMRDWIAMFTTRD